MLAYRLLMVALQGALTQGILMRHPARSADRKMHKEDKEELTFRCTTCNLVLKQQKNEPPPSYCPNCAIQHLGGEMIPVAEGTLDAGIEESWPERSSKTSKPKKSKSSTV